MKHYVKVLFLALGLTGSLNAKAATYNLTQDFGVAGGSGFSTISSRYYVSNGHFTDTFNFSLTGGTTSLDSKVYNLTGVNTSNITLQLFNASNVSLGSVTGASNVLSFSSLAAGNYYFVVNGEGTGGGAHSYYFYNSASVSPAPEPAIWVMMGLGGVLIAGMARRKRAAMPIVSSLPGLCS